MTHSVDAIFVFQMASAVFYVVLGAWVFTLTPRRRQTTLLGVYAVLFGLPFLGLDVLQLLDYVPEIGLLVSTALQTLFIGANLALLALAWTVAEPLEDRRLLGIALVGGAVASLLWTTTQHLQGFLPEPGTLPFWVLTPGMFTRNALLAAAMFVLVLRAHPARKPEREQVTQLAILTLALATFGWLFRGGALVDAAGMLAQGEVGASLVTAASVGVWFVWAGLWGWNMLRADDETVRIHRAAMLGILGLMAVSALVLAAFPQLQPGGALLRGVKRTLGVGLLAYGVLRHDLAGLDAKVEYGLSRTTVAGIFVAVFFIVSEGAQALFAGFAGNEFLGVLAAGALVFAISPLQRMADRFAAKAVPGGAEAGADAEERYRREVEVALADDELTREEERHLSRRADELGIGAERAFEIREQVEDEGAGGDSP